MKKTFTLFAIWFAVVAAFAQSAPTFPYQAVVRNSQNQLVRDSVVTIDVTVRQDGVYKYRETCADVPTNRNGMLSLIIGTSADFTGSLSDVTDWRKVTFTFVYHLTGGDVTITDSIRPVPYALQSEGGQSLTNLENRVNSLVADTVLVHNEIRTLQTVSHSHTNAAVLDSTTASFTVEQKALLDTILDHTKDSRITIKLNGVTVSDFTLNQDADSVINIKVNGMMERFTAAAGQSSFVLTNSPLDNFSVKFYINGVMVGDALESVSNKVVTVNPATKVVTYFPANNGGYALKVGDRVQISYSF